MISLLEIGTNYEIYVKDIIKSKYTNCWLWKDIPNEVLLVLGFIKDIKQNCDDIGCDILAKKLDNTYEYIQCKYYSTLGIDNTICISDLSGFYNFVAENDIKNALVYYSGVLSKQVQCRKNKIKYINLPFIKIGNEDIKPRDYQIEAYNELKDINRGILEMPCGTGKTLITYLISLEYDNIILISPLISTTEQLITHYKKYYNKSNEVINFNIISSQHSRATEDIVFDNKNILGSTFDSCDIVNKLLCKLKGSIFIVIDECHNLSDAMLSENNNEINKILTSNYKILFVSATPKKYNNALQNIFGFSRYTLSWDDAINNKYICNYNFYYPNNDKIIEHISSIKLDISFIDTTILINKAFFLLETIKIVGNKKCIVYLKTVREAEQFKNILKTINLYYNFSFAVYNIYYNTSKTVRNSLLTKFRNNSTKISILLNVHVLDEGIDIPECDSVFITHPNNNPINIIQRISRANRICNGKDGAHIMIWSKNQEKLDCIIKRIETYIPVRFKNISNDFINSQYNQKKELNQQELNQQELNISNNYKFNKVDIINYLNINNVNKILINFIDDFFNLYDENTEDNDFVINIDAVSKWLKILRGNIKKTLVETYRKNIDYKITIEKSTSAGRPKETIYLTPDCFKRLCMLTKSEKGEEVRSYYIQLEKHIDKYKDNIINDLRTRVQVLERNMKPIEIPKNEGVIYVLKTPEYVALKDVYKIGSTEDFRKRLITHHTSHADNVEVKHVYKTSDIKGVERCLIAVLKEKQYRKRKEFYEIDLESLKEIISKCGDTLALVKKSKTLKTVIGGGNKEDGKYYIYLHKESK